VDILRKIGDWAWVNKERLVLAILVVFLVYRIYAVLNPTTIEEQMAQAAGARQQQIQSTAGGGPEEAGERTGPGRPGSPQNRLRRLQQGGTAEEEEETTKPEDMPLVFTQHMPPKRIPDPNNLPEEWTEEEGAPPLPDPNPLPPAPVALLAP